MELTAEQLEAVAGGAMFAAGATQAISVTTMAVGEEGGGDFQAGFGMW